MIQQSFRIRLALFFLLISCSPSAEAQTKTNLSASCNNLDFTSGTTGWQGRWYDPKVTLRNASSPDVVYWNYHFGDGDSVSPRTMSPVHLYPGTASRSYLATLHVRNADGCVNRVEHWIDIGPEFTFYIPNAFTPTRNDGTNDTFFGKGVGIIKYHIWIFDRWGNMVFNTADINEGWDGRANNGKDVAQQDVFVWKVQLTDIFERKHHYIGTVTIVK